jgi:hypothetical protein
MATIVVPQEGQPVKCEDCDEVITRQQVLTDEMRLMRFRNSLLCELCYEDAREAYCSCDD